MSTEEHFDPFESMLKITSGMSYLYNKLNHNGRTKLRMQMDAFTDKLLEETDPMKNIREAQLIMMRKKNKPPLDKVN
jgi:hypothetical protein